ncbi:NAD-dependent deacetylase [Arcticibacter tournemirensis]|uniref:NAD-dependent protein deacylase n=1 Tax=Arcticibacter tournemirensis TaxID=699437 RepID=A0A5M9H750_9SPHI|nr:NAD-dependent deacylase [Arcticibacter tournemirensis]KAA8482762.1 NAD-dependent deacylase [Arcticibacter tournemirensis]TQM51059.1 NAD-dependent deacetylase [Arcticibacter tournemirensis]
MRQKVAVLTGAGISAESGLNTFRDSDGLWEGYDINDVATPEAWHRNPKLVQHFYNLRRKAVLEAEPNAAHRALVRLEEKYDVTIVTQNIDDLHERAGSSDIIHLHGIITKSQSDVNPNLTYPIEGWELKMGEKCELGSQLRPHVVWFGEAVPMIEKAAEACLKADIFLIIGTSLVVYPAAGLVSYVPAQARKILVDPKAPPVSGISNLEVIAEKASTGVPRAVNSLCL